MKKKTWFILTAFLALASVPLFFSNKAVSVSAATNLGTIKVGSQERTFTSDYGLVSTMADLMSSEFSSDYNNKDVVLTLYADVTDSDFLPKSPNGGDLWHNSVTINLNGHTLQVTGKRRHSLGSLVINGGGGIINFSNAFYYDKIFYFNSNSGGNTFSVKDTFFMNMQAENLFYVNECSDLISSINIENCYFNTSSFTQEGGILCFYDDEIKTVNITNCNFRSIGNDDYGSVIYIGNRAIQNLNIKGCEFYGCYSFSDGGVIYTDKNNLYIGNNSNLSFDKNFFVGCYAKESYGGAIYSNGRYNEIENFVFFNNSAKYGGAIYGNWNNLTINRCSFYDNGADVCGGSVYIASEGSKIVNSTFAWSRAGDTSYGGIDIYVDDSVYCQCDNNKFYFSGTNSYYHCNISNDQKVSFNHVKFSDSRNYSGDNLIRGTSQNNPIFISTPDDLYALYINMAHCGYDIFGTRHYLLINPLPGFAGFYDNLKKFTGTFNFGGNFLEFATYWQWDDHMIDPWLLDISDMGVHKDGHIDLWIDGQFGYYKVINSLNIDFYTLNSDNYYIYQNITFNDRIDINGDVTLAIRAGCTVNFNDGIRVSAGNKLKMIGKDGRAAINAISTNLDGAGIGGNYGCMPGDDSKGIIALSGETMGDVNLTHLNVYAKGSGGAGIGGGAGMDGHVNATVVKQHAAPGGGGGTLTITDSDVTAIGDDARDIGGGNGGDGSNEPSGGGRGSNITLNSGSITATTFGIGGGHTGKQGTNGNGSRTSFGSKHGGDGGSITHNNGTIIAKGIGGGDGLLNNNESSGDPNGAATTLNIPDNYGVSYGEDLNHLCKNEKYNPSMNSSIRENFVKIKVLVFYEFRFNSTNNTCYASYTLDGQIHEIVVNTTHVVDKAATCTENELAHEHAVFNDPNIDPIDSETAPVDGTALGHSYGGHVDYVPNFDIGKVTGSWHCQHPGCDSVQSETVVLEYVKDTDATCISNEMGHLEGKFSKGIPTYKTEKNSEIIQDSYKGHQISGNVTYSWNGDSCTASAYCSTCKKIVTETVTGTFVQDIPENCVEPEKGHYHADFTYNFPSTNSQIGATNGPTPAYGHDFHGKVIYEWDEEFYCTATVMCINRDCEEICTEKVKGKFVADTPATCTKNAIGHYLAEFTKLPGIFKTQMTEFNSVEGPGTALGHNFEGKIYYYWNTDTNECTASWYCSRCHAVEQETVVGTFVLDTPATCDENAKGHCVAIFQNENFNTGQATEPNSVEIPNTALGHQFGGPITYEWDEQTHQWTAYQHCQRDGCDDGVLSETCDGIFVETVAPTCLDDAKGYYVSDFKTPGFENQITEKQDYSNPGSALGHEFGGEVTYTWNEETHECTATWGCIHDGCHATQSETVQGQYVADTDATCLNNELGHFEASFETEGFETQSTEANSHEKQFSALGHEFGGEVTYTWNEETHECTATWGCIHGGCGETESETVQGVYIVDQNATCLENEKGHYEATFENPGFGTASTKEESEEIPDTALGHKWGTNIVYTWNDLTHECTALMRCGHAGCKETQIEVATGVYVKDSDATCLENEKGHYEATFTNPYFTKQNSKQFEINETALGHDIIISYEWSDDYKECVATAACSRGDYIETMQGEITYEYGYAIAKFKNSKFKTQSIKLPQVAETKSPGDKQESKTNIIFGASCGAVALVAGLGTFICFKRRIF